MALFEPQGVVFSVGYGESTFNEMCFLVMFAVGTPTACILGSAPLVQ